MHNANLCPRWQHFCRVIGLKLAVVRSMCRHSRAQALHHMTAGPAVWPALARCTALADLCVVLPDAALAERFATLPPSLTRLKASGINALEVCSAQMSPTPTQTTCQSIPHRAHHSIAVRSFHKCSPHFSASVMSCNVFHCHPVACSSI